MIINFEKISAKNFMSYGNAVTTIPLNEDSFTTITGENGVGKSTLLVDALCYALYGKIHRKGAKQSQIINNINKRDMLVELEFNINGKTHYKIERGAKPDVLKLWKDGVAEDEMSSKALIQQEIDDLIQIDSNTFKNISVLSINNNKPFVDLTPEETRNITETLLGLKVYSLMLDDVKKQIKDIKETIKVNAKDYEFIKEIVKDSKEKLAKYKELKDNFEKDKKAKLEKLNIEKKDYEEDIKATKAKLTTLELAKDELNELKEKVEKVTEERSEVHNQLTLVEHEIEREQDGITFFDNNDTCPTCSTIMSEGHKKEEIKGIKAKIKRLEVKQQRFTIKMDKLKTERSKIADEYNTKKEKYNDAKEKNNENTSHINTLEYKLDNVDESVEETIKSNIDKQIFGLIDKKKIKEYFDKYTALKKDKKNFETKFEYLNVLKTILSDKGVKSSVIAKDLPFLNSKIKEYMSEFGKNFYVEFDNEFNVVLKGYTKKGLDYSSLSAGEKKRIDLSILLAFIDVTRTKNSVYTNLLTLDELLDSSIDRNAQDAFIAILKDKIKREQLHNVFIVSHNSNLIIDEAVKLEVYKEQDFSKIKKEGV